MRYFVVVDRDYDGVHKVCDLAQAIADGYHLLDVAIRRERMIGRSDLPAPQIDVRS